MSLEEANGSSPAKKAKTEETLDEVLHRLSPDNEDGTYYAWYGAKSVMNNFLAVVHDLDDETPKKLFEKRCYFLTSSRVSFRHQGHDRESPTKVYVRDLSEAIDGIKVTVFRSASGTGKTVELASSAATCMADFTFILQFSRDIAWEFRNVDPNDTKKVSERNKAALEMMQNEMEKILKGHEQSFGEVLCAKQGNFRLAVAIDEASVCQQLTEALINDLDGYFHREIASFVLEKVHVPESKKVVIDVIFSVGGTGAGRNCFGSQGDRFSVFEPTAASVPALYWKTAVREARIRHYVPPGCWKEHLDPDQLEEELPILGCLMQNGRMASIVIGAILAKNQRLISKKGDMWVKRVCIDEAELVENAVGGYIRSNGLSRLEGPRERGGAAAVAASAFAVYLFQWSAKRPSPKINEAELHKWLYESRSGVEIADDVSRASRICPIVGALISNYGLLEQKHEPFTKEERGGNQQALFSISDRYVMRPPQQLVALHFLGGDLSKMVASNPHGFEYLTTHILKAAIAASSVVVESNRPSIAETLKKIGFRYHTQTTDAAICDSMSKLENFKVVRHYFHQWDAGEYSSFVTLRTKVETEVLKVNGDQGGVYIGYSYKEARGNHDVVVIDKTVGKRLERLGHESRDGELFYPPLACVHQGNSPFADGIVTFRARDTRDAANAAFRMSILNQVKDKHGKGSASITELNARADRCINQVLNGLLGSERLFCVSTAEQKKRNAERQYISYHSSEPEKCKIKRQFISYEISECEILQPLMKKLSVKRKRSSEGRINEQAVFFDGNRQAVELE